MENLGPNAREIGQQTKSSLQTRRASVRLIAAEFQFAVSINLDQLFLGAAAEPELSRSASACPRARRSAIVAAP